MLHVIGNFQLTAPQKIEPNKPFRYWDTIVKSDARRYMEPRIQKTANVVQFCPGEPATWVSMIIDGAMKVHYLFGGAEVRQQAKDLVKIMNDIR